MMNYKFFLLSVMFLLASCTVPKYTMQQKSAQVGITFQENEKLLIAPTKSAFHDEKIKDKLQSIPKVEVISQQQLLYIPNAGLTYSPEEEVFDLLRKTTDYNYLMTTSLSKNEDELGTVNVITTTEDKRSSATVGIKIYDIETGKVVFERTCMGRDFKKRGTKAGTFSKTAGGLTNTCLEKLLNEFVENSK